MNRLHHSWWSDPIAVGSQRTISGFQPLPVEFCFAARALNYITVVITSFPSARLISGNLSGNLVLRATGAPHPCKRSLQMQPSGNHFMNVLFHHSIDKHWWFPSKRSYSIKINCDRSSVQLNGVLPHIAWPPSHQVFSFVFDIFFKKKLTRIKTGFASRTLQLICMSMNFRSKYLILSSFDSPACSKLQTWCDWWFFEGEGVKNRKRHFRTSQALLANTVPRLHS